MKLSIPENILSIKPYAPGKPLEALEREYGVTDSIKLASNENPLGPSPMAVKAIHAAMGNLNRYPDGSAHVLMGQLAAHLNVSTENLVLGNGSDEVIGMLTHAILRPGDEVILPHPSFLVYDIAVKSAGAEAVYVPLSSLCIDLDGIQKKITEKSRMIFLCNPNNPTGAVISKQAFERFFAHVPPQVIIVVDEAYIDFVRDAACVRAVDYLDSDRAVVILRTFSKAYGLAGLRVGYGIMPPVLADALHRIRPPFNVNSLAQIGAAASLKETAFVAETVQLVHQGIDYLHQALDKLEIRYFPTQANFFLIDVEKDADQVFEEMLKLGVIVRSMSSYGYPHYIRVSIGLHSENSRLMAALESILR